MKNAIVLVGAATVVPFQETPPAKRRDDAQTKAQYNPDPNAPAQPGGGGRQGNPAAANQPGRGGQPAAAPAGPPRLTPQQVNTRINEFVLNSGAAVRINDAGREHRPDLALSMARKYDPGRRRAHRRAPQRGLRSNRSDPRRRHARDARVQHRQNRSFPEGKTSYNAIAEIPGTDKADEVVMLGGHLDSWHSATGATDNAIGCAVMMEAARILQAIGVKPRRTIRVALWGGEEQGLLGSKAYVEQHFGTAENPKPEFAKFNGYFNIDGGTGRIRGAGRSSGRRRRQRSSRQYFRQFEDQGVYGASRVDQPRDRRHGQHVLQRSGTARHWARPGPIEYNSHTWHTNLDTLERIVEGDVKKDQRWRSLRALSPRHARSDAAEIQQAKRCRRCRVGAGVGRVTTGNDR